MGPENRRSRGRLVLPLALAVLAMVGLTRVGFDPDVLGMLPESLPEVQGLREARQVMGQGGELVLLLEAGEEDIDWGSEVPGLADRLVGAGLAATVRWQPSWSGGDGAGEWIAWLWRNGNPGELEDFTKSLADDRLDETLAAVLERLSTSADGGEIALLGHDPLGFLRQRELAELSESAIDGSNGYTSADGTAQLLFVKPVRRPRGYREAQNWLAKVRETTGKWAAEHKVKLFLTGDPVFEAEIGSAMERDMRGTITLTTLLIAGMFWFMQRRLSLLLGLAAVMVLVMAASLGLAGWIYGSLSVLAAGFAAVLIGLVVDYGAIICQESLLCQPTVPEIRRMTGKTILGAALTTLAAFLSLGLIGGAGLSQLGVMVACGIGTGAALMWILLPPWVVHVGRGRRPGSLKRSLLTRPPAARMLGVVLGVTAVAVLWSKGLPGIGFDRALLQPRGGTAMAGFERAASHFPEWRDEILHVAVTGEGGEEMGRRLCAANEHYQKLAAQWPERVAAVTIPAGWWPAPENLRRNRENMEELGAQKTRLLAAVAAAGFAEEGLEVARLVLEAAPKVARWPVDRMPRGAVAEEFYQMMSSRAADGGEVVLGRVRLRGGAEVSESELARLRAPAGLAGVKMAGWPLLRPALMPTARRTATLLGLVLAPALVVILALIFRRTGDRWGPLAVMVEVALGALLLLAAMSLLGIQWNFLNIAAGLLLLGTGLDYGIHIRLAFVRHGGEGASVWQGTGKAVVFCALSTAVGFGSLAFGSIEALASLGKVAALGILISMALALWVMPGLGVVSCARAKTHGPADSGGAGEAE